MAAGYTINGPLNPFQFETVTVDNTSGGVALSSSKYAVGTVRNNVPQIDHAAAVFITVEDQDLRWTCDGTAPVATTTGHKASAGDFIELTGIDAIRKFRAIREGGSSSKIQVTYFKI